MKKCKRCGQNPACIRFCNQCAREINHAHEHVMERAVAARAFINQARASSNPEYVRRLEIVAAISIFNPEISTDRAIELSQP